MDTKGSTFDSFVKLGMKISSNLNTDKAKNDETLKKTSIWNEKEVSLKKLDELERKEIESKTLTNKMKNLFGFGVKFTSADEVELDKLRNQKATNFGFIEKTADICE